MFPPEFQLLRQGGVTIWLSRGAADPQFADRLVTADRLFEDASCRIIKDQRKIKIGRLTVQVSGISRSIYVKKYNRFALRYTISGLIFGSGALRSLRGARLLAQGAIPTVIPLAAVDERAFGMLRQSFFISEEIVGGRPVRAFWAALCARPGTAGIHYRRAFLRGLALLFQKLHGLRIYHNDLKEANILAAGDETAEIRFFLLDLEGVRRCRWLSARRRIKNLVQIYRTLGPHLSRAQQLFFLKTYLGPEFSQVRRKRRFIRVLRRRVRRVTEQKARHSRRNSQA